MMLCNMQQANTIEVTVWILIHGGERTTKSVGGDAKGILLHPSGMRQSVVKDPLLVRQSLGTKWLHQPGP